MDITIEKLDEFRLNTLQPLIQEAVVYHEHEKHGVLVEIDLEAEKFYALVDLQKQKMIAN